MVSAWYHPDSTFVYTFDPADSSNYLKSATVREFDETSTRLSSLIEINSNNTKRKTNFTYGVPGKPSQLTSVEVVDGNNNVQKKRWANWSGFLGSGRFELKEILEWDDAKGSTVSQSNAIKVQEITNYDSYGNPLQVKDANGNVTRYYYGSNSSPFSQNGLEIFSKIQGVYLTGIQKIQGSSNCNNCGTRPTSGSDLFTEARYNYLGQLIEIRDENYCMSIFSYDEFGRLKEVRNNADQLMQDYKYEYKGAAISSSNPNYIRTKSYDGSQTLTTIGFFDGLGRPIQTQQSAGGNNAIVQHTFYDKVGREEVLTKPIKHSTSMNFISPSNLMGGSWEPGDPITTSTAAQREYYDDQVNLSDSEYSYSQTAYEASPLGRAIKQAAPGNVYKMSGSRTVDFEYWLNTLSNENFSGLNKLGYANNTLLKQTVTDENGTKSWQFTDGWGRTVMEVVDLSGNNLVSSSAAWDIFTGYEYDLLGNLVKVHEPKGWGSSNYKREYWYDRLGRMISENSPDLAESTEYKYDKAGNLRFVRNAEHKKTESCSNLSFQSVYNEGNLGPISCNKTAIIEYDINMDVQGEVILQIDLQKDDSPWTTIKRNTYDGWDLYFGVSTKTVFWGGEYQLNLEEIYNYNGQWQGSIIGFVKPFRFEYYKYDELGRVTESGEYYGSSSNFTTSNAESATFPTSSKQAFVLNYYDEPNGYSSSARNLKGRLARTRYLDPNTWTWGDTWYSYDEEGRVEWVRQNLPGLATKLIEYSYNRMGQATKVAYQPNSSSDRLFTWYDYDAAGRLYQVRSSRSDNKSNAKLEASYTYTADGQLNRKSLGGTLTDGAQLVDYNYHIRGWLERINNPDNLNSPSGFPDSRFAMELRYESQSENSTNWQAQYNGNISQIHWNVNPPNPISNDSPLYNYKYDRANRLKSADYHNPNAGSDNYDVSNIEYDMSGNFTSLRRYRNSSTSDQYSYRYYSNTNRLMNVAGSSSAQHYKYDRIGNMVANPNRDITSIAYDGRNLPNRLIQKVDSNTANLHEYGYDSEGNRVRKRFNRSFSNTTSYVRGADGQVIAVYQGSSLQFWNLPGGIGRVTK